MLGVELVADRATRAPLDPGRRTGRAICDHARSLGVLLRPLGDVVVLMPPLAIRPDEIHHLAHAVVASVHKVLPPGAD